MVVKKYTWNLEPSLLTVCCTESVLDELHDGVGLAPSPFDIYGLWIFRRPIYFAIQGNLPLVDVLSEDSCGPGPGKPWPNQLIAL